MSGNSPFPIDDSDLGPINSVSRVLPWFYGGELVLDRLRLAIDNLAAAHDHFSELTPTQHEAVDTFHHSLDNLLLAGAQVLALRRQAEVMLPAAEVWAGVGARRAAHHDDSAANTVNPDEIPNSDYTLEEVAVLIGQSMDFMEDGYETSWSLAAADTPEGVNDALRNVLDELVFAIGLFVSITRKFEALKDIEQLWSGVGALLAHDD